MKRLFLIVFLAAFAAQASNLEQTRDVLKWVESEHTLDAIGDDGTSYGILQIRKIAVDDVNRIYGTSYAHDDAFDEICANEIFELYVTYWAGQLEQRECRKATVHDIVRIWNGGPLGYLKTSTKKYLKKFLRYNKNSYLCTHEVNGNQSEMHNQWTAWNSPKEVYAHSGYLDLQNS